MPESPSQPGRRAAWTVGWIVAVVVVVVGAVLVLRDPSDTPKGGHDRAAPATRRAERRQERRCRRRPQLCVPTSTTAPRATTTVPTGPPGSLKPALHGLLDRKGEPGGAYLDGALAGWVVQADWAALQPDPDGPIAPGNVLDQAIARVRALNTAHPGRPLALKLRVYAGIAAPDWVKHLGGEPVPVSNPQSGRSGTVGRFWTSAFGRAYASFEAKMAARYDTVPELREVAISRCTTVFAEPFLRGKGDAASRSALLSAGYTTALDQQCQHEQIDAHRVWTTTRSDLALNPYQDLEQRGPASVDETFTEEMMRYCRTTLGARCVLENNSARYPPNYPELNVAIKAMGAPIAYQTANPAKVGDLLRTIEWAVSQGADSVELPVSYVDHGPDSYQASGARLRAAAG